MNDTPSPQAIRHAVDTRLHEFFDELPQVAFEVDREGRFVFANRAGLDLFGYSEADLKEGIFVYQVVIDADRPRALDTLAQIAAGQVTPAHQYTALRRDGSTFPVLVHTRAVREGGELVGFRGLVIDISEQKAMEAALAEARDHLNARVQARTEALHHLEERYRLLYENMHEIVYFHHADGRIASLNPAFTAITGWSAEAWVGRPLLEAVHEGDRPRLERLFEETLSGHSHQGIQVRLRHIDGDVRICEFSASPWRQGAEIIGIFGTGRDITERLHAEEALRHHDRMAAVGTLAAGVAHEYNNIHTVITGFLEIALNSAEMTPEVAENIRRALEAAQRAAKVTRNLLSFTQPRTASLEPVQLEAVTQEILAIVAHEFASTGVVLDLRFAPIPPVRGDSAQLGQVVMNLIINAYHALQDCPQKRIALETGRRGEQVYLRISDTGCGLAPEEADQLFLPFYSRKGEHAPPHSPQSQLRGTGLGLSVCHTIVEHHGGRIEVESEPDQGAAFTLWFPAGTAAPAPPPPAPTRPAGAERILVVDDEKEVCLLVQTILKRAGYTVACFTEGAEALDCHRATPFDLVLVDIQMPHLNGWEFIHALHEDDMPPAPAVLIITGCVIDDALDATAEAEDVDNVIEKPFGPKDILQHIERSLDRHRTRGT